MPTKPPYQSARYPQLFAFLSYDLSCLFDLAPNLKTLPILRTSFAYSRVAMPGEDAFLDETEAPLREG